MGVGLELPQLLTWEHTLTADTTAGCAKYSPRPSSLGGGWLYRVPTGPAGRWVPFALFGYATRCTSNVRGLQLTFRVCNVTPLACEHGNVSLHPAGRWVPFALFGYATRCTSNVRGLQPSFRVCTVTPLALRNHIGNVLGHSTLMLLRCWQHRASTPATPSPQCLW